MNEGRTDTRTRTVTWDDPGPGLAAAAEMSGLEYIRAIFDRRLPPPPIAVTMGFNGTEAEEGKAVFLGDPGEFLYNQAALSRVDQQRTDRSGRRRARGRTLVYSDGGRSSVRAQCVMGVVVASAFAKQVPGATTSRLMD